MTKIAALLPLMMRLTRGVRRDARSRPSKLRCITLLCTAATVCTLVPPAGPPALSDNLHGDQHPPVDIKVDGVPLFCRADSTELTVWLVGTVAGFAYQVLVQEWHADGWVEQTSALVQSASNHSMAVTLQLERVQPGSVSPGGGQAPPASRRFNIEIHDWHSGLSLHETLVGRKELVLPALSMPGSCTQDGMQFAPWASAASGPAVANRSCPKGPSSTAQDLPFGTRIKKRWMSPQCQNFFARDKACMDSTASGLGTRAAAATRLSPQPRRWLPQTCSREDLGLGGRSHCCSTSSCWLGEPLAWEIVVHHRLKFVYVLNRKAASQTLRWVLLEVLGASMHPPDGCNRSVAWPRGWGEGYCTTLDVTDEMLESYFFFTFTRDPVSKFYAGLFQALKHAMINVHNMEFGTPNCQARLREIAEDMLATNSIPDPHLVSQAAVLSSPVVLDADRPGLPLDWPLGMIAFDFIEAMDLLPDSFPHLLRRIEDNAQVAIPEAVKARAVASVRHKTNTANQSNCPMCREVLSHIHACKTPELDALIRSVYAQDLECGFGRTPFVKKT